MNLALTARGDILRAVLVGLLVAVGTGVVTVPLFKLGIAPMPEAPSLAFAKTLFGPVPDPVGLLFHVLYVTGVTAAVLALLTGARPSGKTIALVSLALYLVAVALFFPIVGWGFAGMAVTPKIAVAAIGPHVLYGLVFWGANRLVFRQRREPGLA
ncbi:hypothetical protein SAMN05216241_10877 [Limimonas halophila]|uniref:Uncharacterized protein n=1 Tax=Limimonas halophila TaxID=1082479 RepID=A0A1G7T3V5_9PROT|nr:hypothetical protein [Limimonas halophila]SDG29945.1 hypothetical protein SAMN05216241_10877 [Limimonas halophila]